MPGHKNACKTIHREGMAEEEISACIVSLWDIFTWQRVRSCQDLNLQMQALGWQDFELDDQAFKMASSVFEI